MLGLRMKLSISFLKGSNVLTAARQRALIRKQILWMSGLIRVHHTQQSAKREIISRFLLMFILRVQISTEAGSSHPFLHRLQAAEQLLISRLLHTDGLLTERAKKCPNLLETVLIRRILLISTVPIFFVFGLLLRIIMLIFVSALKS